jgi:alkylated DNA repair dioxygenase AlkB
MRPLRSLRRRAAPGSMPLGQHYDPGFVSPQDRARIVEWLSQIHPLWEQRFSAHHSPPPGQAQRRLLRPVYWLGNWQFACLDYYRPPHGVQGRCMRAEPFPPVLARLVAQIEERARGMFRGAEMPGGWRLNTCLVNLYGTRIEEGRRVDTARVGEHRDFEPGPVASISLGERALFQFVRSSRPGDRDQVVSQTWLADSSLQLFGGDRWKKQHFHRVQRVETKGGHRFRLQVCDFETRRVNFTFRYVPDQHVLPFAELPEEARADVRGYLEELARGSAFFARALAGG